MALTPLVGDAKNAPPSYWVCVSNERSGTMTVIDGDSWRVSATIPLGKRPRGIHAAADGRMVYVALSGSPIAGPPSEAKNQRPLPPPDRQADGIGVVDFSRRALARMIRVGVDPEEFAFSPDGSELCVSNQDAGAASLVRVQDGVIEQTVQVGPEPEGVAFSPDGRRIFLTCAGSGEIAVLDAHSRRLLTRWHVGGRPRSIAFLPGTSRAFVPSETDARLHVLDLALGRVLGAIALPAGASRGHGDIRRTEPAGAGAGGNDLAHPARRGGYADDSRGSGRGA
jgi:YVTN family beta-propeller protein